MSENKNDLPAPVELSKEELDKLKLMLEIKDLKTPWWKKPAAVTVLLPSIIALCSLFAGFYSGLFETKSALLELKKEKLNKDITEFEKTRKDLENTNMVLSKTNKDLNIKTSELSEQNKILEGEQAQLKKNVEISRTEAATAGLKAPIDGLNRNTIREIPSAVEQMLAHFGQQPRYRAANIAALKDVIAGKDTKPQAVAAALYVLYLETKGKSHRDELFKLLQKEAIFPSASPNGYSINDRLLSILWDKRWPAQDKKEIYSLIIGLIESRPAIAPADIADLAHPLYRLHLNRNRSGSFMFYRQDPDGFLKLVKRVRDITIDRSNEEVIRMMGLDVLQALNPQVFAVVAGKIITDKKGISERWGNSMTEALSYISGSEDTRNISERLQFPKGVDNKEWDNWLAKNNNLVSLWMQDNLTSFRQDHNLLLKTLDSLPGAPK